MLTGNVIIVDGQGQKRMSLCWSQYLVKTESH